MAGTAELVARGTMGALGGPLAFDLDGELREFAVPRANSYLQNQVGWTARAGRLTTKLRGRLQGDALSARTDIRLHRLQLVRATNHDARLVAEKEANLTRIGVRSKDATVRLSGAVPSEAQSARAEALAKGVAGVRRVVNSLVVR